LKSDFGGKSARGSQKTCCTAHFGILGHFSQSEVSKKMGAITIAVIVLCALAGTYLYVMGLCYLCDMYTLQKEKKREAEEKRRKERIRIALDQAEAKRKAEIARRKQLAKARRERGLTTAENISKRKSPPHSASAAHA
jgi:uncharacterized protein YaiL (DUF2058 family)